MERTRNAPVTKHCLLLILLTETGHVESALSCHESHGLKEVGGRHEGEDREQQREQNRPATHNTRLYTTDFDLSFWA